jgi:SOS response regulatory protein OraA/RecX
VNDEGLARDRAAQLRARGAGSAKITADLEARGLPAALVGAAIEAARDGASEREWARRALERAGVAEPRRAWRLLAGRGFPEEVIADLLGEPA